jgi:hypothetical protein
MSDETNELSAIERMLQRLREVVRHVHRMPPSVGTISMSFRDAQKQGHRVVLLSLDQLRGIGDLTLVAFFGLRRDDISDEPLYGADSELIDELRDHSGIVSYSSLDLGEKRSGNVVLATSRQALDDWQKSAKHERVSRHLAPRHYASVRIHTGSLLGGLFGGSEASIATTRKLSFLAA